MLLSKNTGLLSVYPTLYFQQVTTPQIIIINPLIDLYDNYVSLNINGDTFYKSSGDNNTFIDNSYSYILSGGTNQPTQGAFTPLSPTNWSGYFDGGNSYLSIPSNSVLQFSNFAFTIEFWWNPASNSVNYDIMGKWGSEWILQYRSSDVASGKGFRFAYNTSVVRDFSYTTLSANVWTHVGLSKDSSGNYRLFINGTQIGATQTDTTAIGAGSNTNLQIGHISNPYTGYISNLRIIKGTALYTSNFTPNSAEPLKLLPNTSLLTLQNNIFIDNSRNKHTITTQGSPQNRPFSPIIPSSDYDLLLHGGSLYLDGTNYLNVLSNPLLSFPNGTDFTIECWVNLLSLANNRLLAVSTNGFILYLADGTVTFGVYGGTISLTSPANILKINQWYHIAVTRSGTVARLFINGVQVSINNNDTLNYAQNAFRIGADFGTTPATTTGYISNLRIVKGQAVYTSNFTLPNKLVDETSNGGATLIESGTSVPNLSVAPSLLLNFNNGGIIDQSCKNNISVFGNVVTQSLSSKFGAGSLVFDGNGDYLTAPQSDNLNLLSCDFTVEAWVYSNTIATGLSYAISRSALTITTGNDAQYLIFRDAATLKVKPYQGTTDTTINLGTITANTWYHIALVRSGNTFYGYLNGVRNATALTITGALNNNSAWNGVIIGGASTNSWNGLIEDVRITKGIARYTAATEIIPTKLQANNSDPYYNNVTLFLNGNNIGSPVNNVFRGSCGDAISQPFVKNSTPTQGSFSPFSPNGWSVYFNSANYLTTTYSNSLFSFPSGTAFTMECWFNITGDAPLNSSSRNATLISTTDSGGFNGYTLFIDGNSTTTGTGIRFQYYGASVGQSIVATINMSKNKWYHFALTRNSSNVYSMYLNGIKLTTSASTLPSYSGIGGTNYAIGRNFEGASYIYWFLGYISNLRIIKGLDIYQSNFKPPTGPLPALSGSGYSTSLLTLQDNRIKDNSPNNLTISLGAGTPSVQVYSPFTKTTEYSPTIHGGSCFFDTTSYFRISNNKTLFNLSGTNVTIECFVYITTTSAATRGIICQENSSSGWTLRLNVNNTISFFYVAGSTVTSTNAITLNQWNHIALTKSGNIITLYINGISGGSVTLTTVQNVNENILIGVERDPANNRISGAYISNLRVVRGNALYLSNFTPPTSPLKAVNGTILLLSFNNGYVFDSTGNNLITTFGDTKTNVIQTAPLSSSTGSLYFDGVGDYMTVPFNESINNFGLSDFTIETWLNVSVLGSAGIITCWNSWSASANTLAYALRLLDSDKKIYFFANNNANLLTSTTTINANRWYHVAVSRESNVFRLYIDRVLEATVTSSLIMNATGLLHIGRFPDGTESFNGYIDDLRITKGVARYTQSSFTFLPTDRNATFYKLTYPTDPFKNYVVLDLNADAVNAEQNNTFLNRSGNNLTITRTGSTTQGSFSPFSPAGWSGFFNGSTDYLTIPANAGFGLTGDFTIECWVNTSVFNVESIYTRHLITMGTGADAANLLKVALFTTAGAASNVISIYTSSAILVGNIIVADGRWHHIAVTRSGTDLRLYVDGVQSGSTTSTSQSFDAGATTNIQIGRYNNAEAGRWNGYISNLRIVKGQALYNTNTFTPPTAALTTTSTVSGVTLSAENVSLLTLQDNCFKDNSNNNFTILTNGTVSVKPFSPFQPTATYSPTVHGGSGYFPGNISYLSIAGNNVMNFGSSDWTVEAWVYLYAMPTSDTFPTNWQQTMTLIGVGDPASPSGVTCFIGQTKFLIQSADTGYVSNTTHGITINTWNHVAYVRNGNNIFFYVNGIPKGSVAFTGSVGTGSATIIGAFRTGSGSFLNGHVYNLRVVRGAAITPRVGGPTAPVQPVSGTSLLLNFDNAGVVDSIAKNNVITFNTAKVDYANEVYGSGALKFNGTNDYMQVGTASDWTFLHTSNTKWTIEFWLYSNSSNFNTLIDTNGSTLAAHGITLQKKDNNTLDLFVSNNSLPNYIVRATTTQTIPLTTWTHVAITYNHSLASNNMIIYINGLSSIAATKTAQTPSTTTPANTLTIGAYGNGAGQFFNGSIDELRITNAVRYTSNFTVSSYTQPLSG